MSERERRFVNLVFRIGLIEEIGKIDGWQGFWLIRDNATDDAITADWPDYGTVHQCLEFVRCQELFSGWLVSTFEVMEA